VWDATKAFLLTLNGGFGLAKSEAGASGASRLPASILSYAAYRPPYRLTNPRAARPFPDGSRQTSRLTLGYSVRTTFRLNLCPSAASEQK
jgi:hypothetical protein